MNFFTLLEIINSDKHESEEWDFKQEWHENKALLAADIINMLNTPSHKDNYIIFGVSDDQKIVGVENDPNRKTKQQVTDFLHHLPFAQSGFPKIDVQSFEIENHTVDVLTILNSNQVPFFLLQEYKCRGKYLRSGSIYSRIDDSNTPLNESASDERVEMLWKKRFRLDVPVKERFEHILRMSKKTDWYSIFENGKQVFLYNIDMNFKIIEVEDDIKRDSFMEFSYSQFDPRVYWSRLEMFYKNELIGSFLMVSLDGNRLSVLAPSEKFFDMHYPKMVPIEYEIKGSLERAINKLINSFDEYNYKEEMEFTVENYHKDVIVVDSEDEMDEILKKLDPNDEKLNELLYPKNFDYSDVIGRIKSYIEPQSNIDMIAKKFYASHQLITYIKENIL